MQTQFLNNRQGLAIQTGVSRGEFGMNSQEVSLVLISEEVIQPALERTFVNGINGAELTIGVSGCGQRMTFIVICPEGGGGCFAAESGRFHEWGQ